MRPLVLVLALLIGVASMAACDGEIAYLGDLPRNDAGNANDAAQLCVPQGLTGEQRASVETCKTTRSSPKISFSQDSGCASAGPARAYLFSIPNNEASLCEVTALNKGALCDAVSPDTIRCRVVAGVCGSTPMTDSDWETACEFASLSVGMVVPEILTH